MKTILHPDYWVEIPPGQFLTGLSDTQRNIIRDYIKAHVRYERFSDTERQLVASIISKCRQRAKRVHDEGKPKFTYSLNLTYEEQDLLSRSPFGTMVNLEDQVALVPPQKTISLERFYMARFPITEEQYNSFLTGTSATHLPGPLAGSRIVARVDPDQALKLSRRLGGRLPISLEWEKSARGPQNWLYPWGNSWDPAAGYFFYGQAVSPGNQVDNFPRGVSPYGVWYMSGGLPELTDQGGSLKGWHARESDGQTAWFDHLPIKAGRGHWPSLRLVLDEWPAYPLSGFQAGLAVPSAEGRQKMGLLADLLLTQYRWERLPTATLDRLEGAIVALREGRRADCLDQLAAPLADQPQLEAAWLLRLAALEELSEQRAALQQALTLAPQSEVGQKLAALLQDPARLV